MARRAGAGQRRWSLRWWELVPEAVLVAGLTYFAVDESDAATSAFKSTRAVLLMVAVAVAWLVARVCIARFVDRPALSIVPFAVGAVAILAVVVLPAYRDHRVVEQLEADTIAPGPAAEVSSPMPAAGLVPVTPTTPAAAPQPIRTAALRGIDHRARGTVTVYRHVDGRYVVGFEAFEIQPGPDYDVYVVPGADRTAKTSGTRLDDLRGNVGTQYYDTPAGLDLGSGVWTVLVWCQTFGVPVANAVPVA
jgi:hypothetical protein